MDTVNDSGNLSIGDYLTIPIVDLVTDPDFDIGVFSMIASLSRVIPSDDLARFHRLASEFSTDWFGVER